MKIDTRSKHVKSLWSALQASGVKGICLDIDGIGVVPLEDGMLMEFLRTMRGNKIDSLMGSFVGGIKAMTTNIIEREAKAKAKASA